MNAKSFFYKNGKIERFCNKINLFKKRFGCWIECSICHWFIGFVSGIFGVPQRKYAYLKKNFFFLINYL